MTASDQHLRKAKTALFTCQQIFSNTCFIFLKNDPSFSSLPIASAHFRMVSPCHNDFRSTNEGKKLKTVNI